MGDKCVTNPDIQVAPGQVVKFLFKNDDVAPHDLLFPEMDLKTRIVRNGASVALEFEAPDKEGIYEYTCSLHPFRMSGNFIVKKDS